MLDVILFGRFLSKIWFGFTFQAPEDSWWFNIFYMTQSILIISFLASGFGLACQKRWGFILSYVQFPFRYLFLLLSFGFIAVIFPMQNTYYFSPVIIIAMLLEIGRLILTIMIQKKDN